jgi:hypothetical protein
VRRRRLLAALSGVAAGAAGCTGPADDGSAATPTDEADTRITDTSFVAGDGECGSGEDAADVTVDGGVVRVDGRLATPTPCHGAALAEARLADGGDRLVVAVRTTDPTVDVCVQCLGAVPYDLTVRVADGSPETVRVDHDGETVRR